MDLSYITCSTNYSPAEVAESLPERARAGLHGVLPGLPATLSLLCLLLVAPQFAHVVCPVLTVRLCHFLAHTPRQWHHLAPQAAKNRYVYYDMNTLEISFALKLYSEIF